MKVKLAFIFVILLAVPIAVFAGGSSSTCATKYPIVLAHGMGAQAKILGFIDYWGDIPGELRDEGARVYVTSVNAMDATAKKGASLRQQILEILAITGAAKVNIIGHSHGTIYSRYAITNLGLGSAKVASHTSIGGPHRGSAIADMIMGLIPNIMEPLIGDVLNLVFSFVMGDVGGNSVQNGYDVCRSTMQNVFNPNCPNVSGIYYQSWAGSVTNPIAAGLLAIPWAALMIIEGSNDGLVSVTSARWGTYRGTMNSASWYGGVNHIAECVPYFGGLVIGWDASDFFVSVVSELKNKGY